MNLKWMRDRLDQQEMESRDVAAAMAELIAVGALMAALYSVLRLWI